MSDATTVASTDNPEASASAIPKHPAAPTNRRVLGEISPNKVIRNGQQDWEKDYVDLAKRYAALEARFEAKQLAGRKVRDERNAWMKYAEKLEARLKKEKRRQNLGAVAIPASSTAVKPTAPDATEATSSALSTSFASNPESNSKPGQHDDAVQQSNRARRAVSTPAIATQQNEPPQVNSNAETHDEGTGDDVDPPELPVLPRTPVAGQQILIKREPLSDDVVVISERELRKRKAEGGSNEMEPPARRVKSEFPVSSDPVVTAASVAFLPQESMDFDAGPQGFPTPKRQRFLGAEAYNNGEVDRDGNDTEDTTSRVPLGNTARETKLQRMRGTDGKLDQGIPGAAVDVVELSSSAPPKKVTEAASAPPAQGKQSDAGSARNNAAGPESAAIQQMPQNIDHDHDSFDVDLDLVALRVLRERQEKQRMSAKLPVEPTAPPKVNDKPTPRFSRKQNQAKPGKLRERPVEELLLGDFKINPKLNNGYKHAYEEVVRDKAGRAELSGCIDPNCCGKQFRAMAQSELNSGGSAILSQEDNIQLLEKYLGDEAFRLIGMTIEDKRKLWLDAKTRDLANKYGRHRHRFARRPSPPGYWDMDFPSTQEVAKNREEARKIERGKIEERRREAMRGGRWLFRD
ncbi:DNA repair protein endonuclease SAE2/CtIP C-terminus-domain-containing protein, partial [Cercophora newfieldiana]